MSPGLLDGLVLAATAADDRDASAVEDGLAPHLAEALETCLGELRMLARGERESRLGQVAARLSHVPPDALLPPRAATILAGEVPRDAGLAWARSAPPVRRGYRVPPGLKATLRQLAHPPRPNAEAQERAAAPSADPRLRAWAEELALDGADVERVVGALALGARGELDGDGESRTWRRIGQELGEAWETPWPR